MLHNCTSAIGIIVIAMANLTWTTKTYMPSTRLLRCHVRVCPKPLHLLPIYPTSWLCVPVEANGEEKRRRQAKTKEGLGHRPWKDHSPCSSGVSGWDVWYPFLEKSELHNTCLQLKWAPLFLMIMFSRSGLFSYFLLYLHLGVAAVCWSWSKLSGEGRWHLGQVHRGVTEKDKQLLTLAPTDILLFPIYVRACSWTMRGSWRTHTDSVHPERLHAWGLNSQPW